MKFAILGAAGFVAKRHLKAIQETGNEIIAAVDPYDAVGFLDGYSLNIEYFKETETFIAFAKQSDIDLDYISVCTPNHLHFEHCKIAMSLNANVICEKPLVIDPSDIDRLLDYEAKTGKTVNTVLQLRLHPKLLLLKDELTNSTHREKKDVILTYVPARGKWYKNTWKSDEVKSGGIATNIGIHFFDLLLWLFGNPLDFKVYHRSNECVSGYLELESARVKWFLSIDSSHLPSAPKVSGQTTYRSITVNEHEIDFTHGIDDLHTRVYQVILSHRGFGIEAARPSLELVNSIRNAEISSLDIDAHPFLLRE